MTRKSTSVFVLSLFFIVEASFARKASRLVFLGDDTGECFLVISNVSLDEIMGGGGVGGLSFCVIVGGDANGGGGAGNWRKSVSSLPNKL